MSENREKIHIRLHVYDTDVPLDVFPEYEPFCRNAAKLITNKVNSLSELYGRSRGEKDILYMAMLDIAINLELEKTNNDTKPYDDILSKLTDEIEEALNSDNK